MKGIKKRKSIISYIIIILVLILVVLSILILFNTELSKNNSKQTNTNVEFKLPFEEKEYKNLVGYNFYTKKDGTVLIKSDEGYEMTNVPTDGTIINVKEKVVKIEVYTAEGNGISSNVLLLTENGNLYNLDLGQDIINDSNLYKYPSNQKIKDIKLENIQSVWHNVAIVAELENGEIKLVGQHNILISPSEASIGKKVMNLSVNGDYIVIENDNRVRIGDINKDKYYSIAIEKWINENADITNYTYLKDDSNLDIKAKDFSFLNQGDITSLYIITNEGKLIYMSISNESLLKDTKVIEKYEIKLSKIASEFMSIGSNTVSVKFTDGTYANIKDNNLIFGMLSDKNNFFTFSKQDFKNNIDYKILTNKLGVNYKIKEYETIDSIIYTTNTYIINIFMITEDNKMIMTRISNSKIEDYIDIMKVDEISSEKLIEKFEKTYSEYDGYTTNVIFKDGSKIDLKTFVKDYLSLG